MCRLMGYVASKEVTFTELLGSELESFRALSSKHKDSWGISANSFGNLRTTKFVESAIESVAFPAIIAEHRANGALLHLREASKGISVTPDNAHPFAMDDLSFIHNGTIFPHDALLGSIPEELMEHRKGSTDSELFFLMAVDRVRRSNLIEGVKSTIRELRDNFKYSGINSMFLDGRNLMVVCEFNEDDEHSQKTPGYYELRFRADSEHLIVASSGWGQDGWILIPNHHALIVDRKTLEFRVEEI